MLIIKPNKGDSSVSNSSFTNFIGHSNAYSLDIIGYWTQRASSSGNGVTLYVCPHPPQHVSIVELVLTTTSARA
jgi:hypothetical protein